MSYIDDQIKHRVALEKLKNSIAFDILKRFNLIYPQLSDILVSLEGKSQSVIIKEINKIIDNELKEIKKNIESTLIDIAKYEYQFQNTLIATYTTKKVSEKVISNELAKSLVFDNLMAGELYQKTINRFGQGLKDEVEKSVRLGITNGLTAKQISSQVKTNVNIKRNQLDSITRTVTQSVVNSANEQSYKNNKIKKYKYLAILDSRTTDRCKSLNNKIFEVGNGPIPPQHFNCRSFTIPIDEEIEDKNYDTYNEWYNEQENKKDIKSNSVDKFETNEKITLTKLREEL